MASTKKSPKAAAKRAKPVVKKAAKKLAAPKVKKAASRKVIATKAPKKSAKASKKSAPKKTATPSKKPVTSKASKAKGVPASKASKKAVASKSAKPSKATQARDVLDFSEFPAGSVSRSDVTLCLACIFRLFTNQLGLAPRTAYDEIRRYSPTVEELTTREPQRPFFKTADEKNARCPYCDAARSSKICRRRTGASR